MEEFRRLAWSTQPKARLEEIEVDIKDIPPNPNAQTRFTLTEFFEDLLVWIENADDVPGNTADVVKAYINHLSTEWFVMLRAGAANELDAMLVAHIAQQLR